MKMRPFGTLLPLAEAQAKLLEATTPVSGFERVPLDRALGRVAAAKVRAPVDVPPFQRATWDGYALRSEETREASPGHPVRFRLVGEVFAEGRFRRPLAPGEAVAVATGGAMPKGADAVLIFEDAAPEPASITARRFVPVGEKVAPRGADFRKGAILVEPGQVLDPAGLGAIAATGGTAARVFRAPRATLIPNGNELVVPGGRLRPGSIFEINNTTIAAVARAAGATTRAVRPIPDDAARIERAIREAMRVSDVVIITGGSSVGERDFLPQILPKLGKLLFHGIAVRPGKPTLAAVAGRRLLIGMPGHPTSCLSNAFWLLVPALRRMAHLPGPGWVDGSARLEGEVRHPSADLATIVPLHLEDGIARPTFRDSSAITSLAGANAFAILPPGSSPPSSGDTISLHRLLPPVGAAQTP